MKKKTILIENTRTGDIYPLLAETYIYYVVQRTKDKKELLWRKTNCVVLP